MISETVKKEFCFLRDRIIEQRYQHLDDRQRNAVFNSGSNCIVVACPGAGKTQVIIHRIDYLCKFGPVYSTDYVPESLREEDLQNMRVYLSTASKGKISVPINRIAQLLGNKGIDAKNVIVITFTKAAAKNMKERYMNNYGENNTPFFGTFHGLFYKILKRYRGNINIIGEYEKYRLIRGTLLKYMDEISDDKIKEIVNDISLMKSRQEDINNFKAHVDKEVFKECFDVYNRYKEEKGLMDFDDLQLECIKLFRENKKLCEGYGKLFKYILVDEFQDVDSLQIEFLKIFDYTSNIYAVGDEDQCIYSFRGSKPECMVEFQNIFNGGDKVYLSTNYRSVSNIVEISKELIDNNVMRNSKDINPFKNFKGNINIINSKNQNSESDKIALEVQKVKAAAECSYSDIAVLYRTNVESRSLIDSFIRRNIPFTFLDREFNFFNHFICKDLIAYLKLSLDSTDRESFFRIINKPFRYISKLALEKVRRSINKENCFDILKAIDDIPVFQLSIIDKLKKDIALLNKLSLLSAVQYVISDLGYADYIRDYSMKYGFDVDELNDIMEEFKSSCEGYNSITTFLVHVDKVAETMKTTKFNRDKNKVILSTIHGVKGMEFKNVFIVNCVEDNIPHKNSIPDNIEEERRLFYVGITRAIDNLWLCITNEVKGSVRKPSRFIKECNLEKNGVELAFKEGDVVEHTAFGRGKIVNMTTEVTEIQFENVARKFDTTVLVNCDLVRKIG